MVGASNKYVIDLGGVDLCAPVCSASAKKMDGLDYLISIDAKAQAIASSTEPEKEEYPCRKDFQGHAKARCH